SRHRATRYRAIAPRATRPRSLLWALTFSLAERVADRRRTVRRSEEAHRERVIAAHRADLHHDGDRRRGHLPSDGENLIVVLLRRRDRVLEEPEDAPGPLADDLFVEAAGPAHLNARAGRLLARPDERLPELLLASIKPLLPVDLEDHLAHDRVHGL